MKNSELKKVWWYYHSRHAIKWIDDHSEYLITWIDIGPVTLQFSFMQEGTNMRLMLRCGKERRFILLCPPTAKPLLVLDHYPVTECHTNPVKQSAFEELMYLQSAPPAEIVDTARRICAYLLKMALHCWIAST
jgi:hypothetical protein